MLFKIIYRHWNCFLSSGTTDGKDGLGLKLEIVGPTFSSFNVIPAKTTKKVLTHSLLDILPKTRFEASCIVFWLPLHYKELKLTTKPFTSCALHSLLIQMQTVSLWSLGMRRKQNFEIVFGLKSDTAVLAFTFCLLHSPLFSIFLLHLVGFILVGRVFYESF